MRESYADFWKVSRKENHLRVESTACWLGNFCLQPSTDASIGAAYEGKEPAISFLLMEALVENSQLGIGICVAEIAPVFQIKEKA